VVRRVQAHSALGKLLFDTGRWDEAMAEVQVLHEDQKEPAAACVDLGIAAVICFHRGDLPAARRHLAAAVLYAERIGNRVISPLALAHSLDYEHVGAPAEALTVLTAGFAGNAEELDEIEDLLADAVRLAALAGDLDAGRTYAGHATALAADSAIPHRQATEHYCRGLLGHDAVRLLIAADRYRAAGRPLLSAKALEEAAGEFIRTGDRDQGRAAFIRAMEIYTLLGAATDVARLQARFRAYGIRRGPLSKHRQARSGWDSLTPTEVKVAKLVEAGLSNPEIAARLLLSRRTVATHVSHILRKLGVHSRIDIAREAALRAAASK
jgi:DNA-binding CsgD family transcriptional regulator